MKRLYSFIMLILVFVSMFTIKADSFGRTLEYCNEIIASSFDGLSYSACSDDISSSDDSLSGKFEYVSTRSASENIAPINLSDIIKCIYSVKESVLSEGKQYTCRGLFGLLLILLLFVHFFYSYCAENNYELCHNKNSVYPVVYIHKKDGKK